MWRGVENDAYKWSQRGKRAFDTFKVPPGAQSSFGPYYGLLGLTKLGEALCSENICNVGIKEVGVLCVCG